MAELFDKLKEIEMFKVAIFELNKKQQLNKGKLNFFPNNMTYCKLEFDSQADASAKDKS